MRNGVIERGGPEWQRRRYQHLELIRERIRVGRFVVQGVFGAEPGDLEWAYTVGLTREGRPELVCVGLSIENCTAVLAYAADAVQGAADGELVMGAGDGVAPVVFRLRAVRAATDDYPLAMVQAVYPQTLIRAVQVVWPDSGGAYPGDPGWDGGPQPLLPAEGAWQPGDPVYVREPDHNS